MSAQAGRRTPAPDSDPLPSRTGTADQACRECRRRKSKCDRTIPVCRLCGKFARVCTYEKSARTPLTRTYLSKVENELARTKALLQRFMPEGQQDDVERDGHDNLDGAGFGYDNENYNAGGQSVQQPVLDSGLAASATTQVDPSRHQMPLATPSLESQHRARVSANPVVVDLVGQHPRTHMRPVSESRSIGTTAFSLETPPSSSNFEWDERAGTAGGDRFVDGMASLTSRSNEGGYLGVYCRYVCIG